MKESYLIAGLIVTASTVGAAISSPWRGRILDNYGLKRSLIAPIIINLIFWATVPLMPLEVLIPAVFIAGLFSIPVFSIVRTSLAVIIPAQYRKTAFALDSVLTELVWMIGPAVGTIMVFSINSTVALWAVGAAVVIAGIGLIIVDPPVKSSQLVLPTKLPTALETVEKAATRNLAQQAEKAYFENTQTGSIPVIDPSLSAQENNQQALATKYIVRKQLLTLGGLSIMVATIVSNFALIATDLGIVGLLEEFDDEEYVGLAITIWCAGSALGGLAYGAIKYDIKPLWVLMVLSVLTLPLAFTPDLTSVLIAVFVAGVAVAPILASTAEAIARRVPEEARGEAMGWHGSAMTIGASLGGPIIGVIIDRYGASAAFLTAGILGGIIAGLGLIATKIYSVINRKRLAQQLAI